MADIRKPSVILSGSESRFAGRGGGEVELVADVSEAGVRKRNPERSEGALTIWLGAKSYGLLRFAQDLGSGLRRPLDASTSTPRP